MSHEGEATLGRLRYDRGRLIRGVEMIRLVGEALEVTSEGLRSAARHAAICRARDIAAYVLRERGGFSYPEIGALLGGRDHSSAIAAVRRAAALQAAAAAARQAAS